MRYILKKLTVKRGSVLHSLLYYPVPLYQRELLIFDISKVVFDGSFFYFGCGDGNLYCFNLDGVLVWSKPNYTPLIHDLQFATLYHHAGRLYYIAPTNKIVCIDAASGTEIWQTYYNVALANMQSHLELTFSNTKMFAFGRSVIFGTTWQQGRLKDIAETTAVCPFRLYPLPTRIPSVLLIASTKICLWNRTIIAPMTHLATLPTVPPPLLP